MTTRLPLALVPILLVLTAGCLGGVDPAEPAGRTSVPATPGSERVTWFLGGVMDLHRTAPTAEEPQRVAGGNFYARWSQGEEQPTWRGAPAGEDLLLTGNATLTFWVEAQPVVATTGPAEKGFPEYVAYFGTEESPVAYASVQGPDVMVRGEPVRVQANLTLPPGGLVLEEGVRPVVIIAPVQGQDDRTTRLDFLVNATSAPSNVSVHAEPTDLPTPRWHVNASHEGVLAGSAYAADAPTVRDTFPVEVNGSTERVALHLTSEGAGVRDIDLALLGPDGSTVALSATPHPREGIVLHTPALRTVGPGTWTVQVTNYGHAAVAYDLSVAMAGR